MPTTITISGFKEFAAKCGELARKFPEEFDEVAGIAAADWELRAKQAAPVDVGFLRGGISHKRVSEGHWEVVSAAEYSAYIEWGTRLKVRVPADLQAYASQFKGAGGQKGAKKFIFAWCQRKGIDKEAWWPIFISIMRNGITPHPFFFVQKPIIEQQLINDLKQLVETER